MIYYIQRKMKKTLPFWKGLLSKWQGLRNHNAISER